MIFDTIVAFYVACQIFMLALCSYLTFSKKEDMELNKENIIMMSLLCGFGPLGVMCFFGVIMWEKSQNFKRTACTRALTKWENKAMEVANQQSKWDWHINGKKSEARYNALRETIDCLTDAELAMLVSVNQNTYDLEKLLREAIMDEIIHRELMKP